MAANLERLASFATTGSWIGEGRGNGTINVLFVEYKNKKHDIEFESFLFEIKNLGTIKKKAVNLLSSF